MINQPSENHHRMYPAAGDGSINIYTRQLFLCEGTISLTLLNCCTIDVDFIMIRSFFSPASSLRLRFATSHRRCFSSDVGRKASDPLRVLFCGSDAFSCESLRALHREHENNKKLIESLDVMVLPPRRTGRGFKEITEGWYPQGPRFMV